MSYSVLTKKSSTVNTENSGEVDEREIESAIEKHGVTPGGSYMMKAEAAAANESMNSGLYVTFSPHPSCSFTSAAYDGIKDGTSQCCRIGNKSICTCGHSLLNHQPVKLRSGYIKPPTCLNCRCGGYSYSPARPEECGQWWLPRRKDFILREWQQVMRLDKTSNRNASSHLLILYYSIFIFIDIIFMIRDA
jgi:hypothetical protein